jgi:hypothetical protein
VEYLIGVGLALGVCAFAMADGFDRDSAFYPMLLACIQFPQQAPRAVYRM